MLYRLLRFIFAPLVKILWIRSVEGIDNIPKGSSLIIASNHQSYLDFFCFMAICQRQIHYLTKKEHFENKIWCFFLSRTGQILVDRENFAKTNTYQDTMKLLQRGEVLGVFPEGTRSATGKLRKAHTGIAKIVLASGVPVLPVGIKGTYGLWSRLDKFPKFARRCEIRIGKPLSFSELYNKDKAQNTLLYITNTIMRQIAKLIDQEYPE